MDQEKNTRNLLKYLEPLITTVFWLLLFISPLLLGESEYGIDWTQIFNIWKDFIPYLVLFLLNRFVLLPFLFFRNNRLVFFISNTLLILILAAGVHHYKNKFKPPHDRAIRQEIAPPPPKFDTPPRRREPAPGESLPPPMLPPRQLPPFISFMVISVLVIGFDTGLVLSVKWAQSERKRIHAEKENVETQLAFLRNQVSPHFFMNTLNNIHALIDQDSEEAKESIIRLSKLMRHLLYDSEREKIPIGKEIDFIRNYVDLMKMRYSEKILIDLQISGQFPDKSIPPLLFTSFVENAFKHGISYLNSSFIHITFFCTQEFLTFEIRNSIAHVKQDEDHMGIGLENARRRLDLIFGDKYSLNIEAGKDEHFVRLTIPL
jgi:hypothetical protein